MYGSDVPVKDKSNTILETFIQQIQEQNKTNVENVHRLSKLKDRLSDESGGAIEKSGPCEPSRPSIPGHLSQIEQSIEAYKASNYAMQNIISKLEVVI